MTREIRVDAANTLRAPFRTPQGFLRVDGYVSRAGIYEYINTPEDEKNGYGKAGALRRELRPEEDVSRDEVLAGFEGAPLTAQHPKQNITAENARTYEVGTVTERARWDATTKRVAASMVIKDPKTIAKVEGGELNELSPGYKAMIYKTPGADKRYAYAGNPDGRYDCIQRDIEVNHLALVESARGGGDLRVRLDSDDGAAIESSLEERAFDMLVRYGCAREVEPLRSELVDKSDAYRATRLDALLQREHEYRHRWAQAEIVAAGNRDEKARRRRYASVRNDAAIPAPHEPSVRWPDGFNRAKAIETLSAASVAPRFVAGSMYATLQGASDVWLLAALNQLLDSGSMHEQIAATLTKVGYRPSAVGARVDDKDEEGPCGVRRVWSYPRPDMKQSRGPMFPGLEDDE